MPDTIRPTKKQKELLSFIGDFIAKKGYSPSYREIMSGLNYNSVATVALHVNNLISRGHLVKRENSARSLEVVANGSGQQPKTHKISDAQEKWLIKKIEGFFKDAESAKPLETSKLDKLYVLVASLKVLGLNAAAQSFMPRLNSLKERVK